MCYSNTTNVGALRFGNSLNVHICSLSPDSWFLQKENWGSPLEICVFDFICLICTFLASITTHWAQKQVVTRLFLGTLWGRWFCRTCEWILWICGFQLQKRRTNGFPLSKSTLSKSSPTAENNKSSEGLISFVDHSWSVWTCFFSTCLFVSDKFWTAKRSRS